MNQPSLFGCYELLFNNAFVKMNESVATKTMIKIHFNFVMCMAYGRS